MAWNWVKKCFTCCHVAKWLGPRKDFQWRFETTNFAPVDNCCIQYWWTLRKQRLRRYSKFCLYIHFSPLLITLHIALISTDYSAPPHTYTSGCSCHISVAVHAVVHVLSWIWFLSPWHQVGLKHPCMVTLMMNTWNITAIGHTRYAHRV